MTTILKKILTGRSIWLILIEGVLLAVHHMGGPAMSVETVMPYFDTLMMALELFVAPAVATGLAHHAPQPVGGVRKVTVVSLFLAAFALPACGVYDRPPNTADDPVDFYWDQAAVACNVWLERQRSINPEEVVDFVCAGQQVLRPFYDDVVAMFGRADARSEARAAGRE